MVKAADIGPDLKRMRLMASLTEAEVETLLDDAHMKRRLRSRRQSLRSRGAAHHPGAEIGSPAPTFDLH